MMNEKSHELKKRAPGRRISSLMLERYCLGEVTEDEQKFVEAELAAGGEINIRSAALKNSDDELRCLYPWSALNREQGFPEKFGRNIFTRRAFGGRQLSGKFIKGLCAAALFLCVFFPSFYYLKGKSGAAAGFAADSGITDRAKGNELRTGLAIYLNERVSGKNEIRSLPNRTFLKEGNTIQLAYAVPPGDEYYGVIFSIDGRSALTLHYPYRKDQRPVLTAGKQTFLDEAYTLDDAPDFEVFFMVTSRSPLDTESVLQTAEELAADPKTALEKCGEAFSGCEVETITIRKRNEAGAS